MADKKEKGKKRVEEKGTEGVCREERRSGQGRRNGTERREKMGLRKGEREGKGGRDWDRGSE